MKRGKGGAVKRRNAFTIDPGDAARLQEAIELHGTLTNGEVAQARSRSFTRHQSPCMDPFAPRPRPRPQRTDSSDHRSRFPATQILRADAPPCALYDKKCAGKADNPNCLCGLIPAPTGHRRQGLWQKDAAALAKLGPDPSSDKREVWCNGSACPWCCGLSPKAVTHSCGRLCGMRAEACRIRPSVAAAQQAQLTASSVTLMFDAL